MYQVTKRTGGGGGSRSLSFPTPVYQVTEKGGVRGDREEKSWATEGGTGSVGTDECGVPETCTSRGMDFLRRTRRKKDGMSGVPLVDVRGGGWGSPHGPV